MVSVRKLALASALATMTLAAGGAAKAQTPEQFYKGKTVSIMIGYGVGGSDDLWARLIAKHIGDFLPGHPTAVPVNVPGAGSLLLANQIYNTQPKDGTVFGVINRGVPFEPMLGGQGARFDPAKMSWIGSPDMDTAVCAARKDSAVRSIDDLATRELVVGGTGSGADSAVYPLVLSQILGLKFKMVSGYPGSRDIGLALERGEVRGLCLSYDTVTRENYYRNGSTAILFQMSRDPDPRLDKIPVATTLAKTDEDRQALQLFLQRTAIGRPFAAPPGVPADRLAALREAFAKVLQDPTFREEAERSGLHVRYISPEDIAASIEAASKTPAPAVERLKKAFSR